MTGEKSGEIAQTRYQVRDAAFSLSKIILQMRLRQTATMMYLKILVCLAMPVSLTTKTHVSTGA